MKRWGDLILIEDAGDPWHSLGCHCSATLLDAERGFEDRGLLDQIRTEGAKLVLGVILMNFQGQVFAAHRNHTRVCRDSQFGHCHDSARCMTKGYQSHLRANNGKGGTATNLGGTPCPSAGYLSPAVDGRFLCTQ